MGHKEINQLIINNPFEEPKEHWFYIRENQDFERRQGRRLSGYWRATAVDKERYDDPGEFVEIPLVNRIRPRVKEWKKKGYPNVTGVTKKLLQLWNDPSRRHWPLFWAQLEAIETAIWLIEASPAERQGILIPESGDDWSRECLKLATGTGKTVIVAMIIAWQVLNKIFNNKDPRFSKHILVIAPGLTVRDRLQVLRPSDRDNFYEHFTLVDGSMWQELQKAKIIIKNWHALSPINENYGPKVIKKGPEGNEAFVRRVLPEFGGATNFLIINDEAHHCHRPSEKEEKKEKERATIWISGIDRIHRARGVLKAYDLTATPFKPTGKASKGEQLFKWIVSDFGLNDAIESGLVKTPKIAVRDDSAVSKDVKSKLYHVYPEVRRDINRRAQPHENLPDLINNAMNILGADWLKEKGEWQTQGRKTPPVMIIITNRTETAARLEYSLKNGYLAISELGEADKLLRIDQDTLDKIEAEESEQVRTKKELVEQQRAKFNTVGKEGKPGEQIYCVIGVNMLSEGWDARTVTHILGIRAFTSQLLCEQVIGRGLRRVSYEQGENGLFSPEYVTVFGIPFTFLPIEGKTAKPQIDKPKTKIGPLPERQNLSIEWPHVLRVESRLNYFLDLDWGKLVPLVLSPQDAPTVVEVAPVIDGKPKFDQLSPLVLDRLAESQRIQTLKLQAASRLREKFSKTWAGDPGSQIGQLMQVIDRFIASEKLDIKVPNFEGTQKLKNIIIAQSLQKIINHIGSFIQSSSKEVPVAILDDVHPKRSTATAPVWYTERPTQPIKKSQISHVVLDSRWEAIGFEFERERIPGLISWVKNDHLGFEIYYLWHGEQHTYYPDYILRFENNRYLLIEIKGYEYERDREFAKWRAAKDWVAAVNANANFGTWDFQVLKDPKDLFDMLK